MTAEGDGYPARRVAASAASDLAQRYQVSRIHVRRPRGARPFRNIGRTILIW